MIKLKAKIYQPPNYHAVERAIIDLANHEIYPDFSRVILCVNEKNRFSASSVENVEYEGAGKPNWKYQIDNLIPEGKWKVLFLLGADLVAEVESD